MRAVHKFCAWSGTLCLIEMLIGFTVIAGFIPTRSPGQGMADTAQSSSTTGPGFAGGWSCARSGRRC
jgi:hypothetical protein